MEGRRAADLASPNANDLTRYRIRLGLLKRLNFSRCFPEVAAFFVGVFFPLDRSTKERHSVGKEKKRRYFMYFVENIFRISLKKNIKINILLTKDNK